MQMGLYGYLSAEWIMLHKKNSESKKLTTLLYQEASMLFVPEEDITSSLEVACLHTQP